MNKYNPHKKPEQPWPCDSNDLILVSEGVQCGNCLALVVEHVPDEVSPPCPVCGGFHIPYCEIMKR